MRQTIRVLLRLGLGVCLVGTYGLWAHGSFSYIHYTTADGLPHAVGYEMVQDSLGYLWIGTDIGLLRFDGRSFDTYRMGDGLPTPYVISVSLGPEGSIYAGGHRHYLTRLSYPDFSPATPHSTGAHNPKPLFLSDSSALCIDLHLNRNPGSFSRCFVKGDSVKHRYCILEESEGESLIAIKHADSTSFVQYANYINQAEDGWYRERYSSFHGWFQDRQGQIWLLTSHGLYRYEEDRLVQVPSSAGTDLHSMYQAIDGTYWLGGEGCLYRWQPGSGFLRTPLPDISQPILQIKALSNGSIYFFTEQREELYRWNVATQTLEKLSQKIGLKSSLSFLFLDQEEQLWFTTNGDGIYCIYHHSFDAFYPLGDHLSNSILATQQTADGQIWLISGKELLRYVDGQIMQIDLIKSENSRPFRIRDLFQKGHRLLLSSTHGLHFFDFLTGDTILCEDWIVKSIFATKPKGYVLFSHKKLWFPSRCADRPDNYFSDEISPMLRHPQAFCKTPSGQQWFGDSDGLFLVEGEQTTRFLEKDGLPNRNINDLLLLGDTLWIATNMGLSFYHQDSIQRVSFACLSNGSLQYLLSDHLNRIWITTPAGLYCYDGRQVYGFSTADGLPTNDINHLMIDQDSMLWISTSSGVSRLDLTKPLPLSAPPQVFFRSIKVNGQAVRHTPRQRLSFQDGISVTFGSVAFKHQKNLSWQYRLDSQGAWQSIDAWELALSNLRDGSYHLQVRARVPNSDWSEPQSWQFDVARPWYRRPGWLALLGLSLSLLFGAGYLVYQRRKTRQQSHKLELDRRLAGLELQALQAQMNPHFIFNALNAIQHFVISQEVEAANEYLSRFSRLIRQFLEASRRRFYTLEEEIELLEDYLEMEHLCYGEHFSYTIDLVRDPQLLDWELPAMLLQPLVENAIRHGLVPRPSPGRLQIAFFVEKEWLHCIIEDNGVGRDHHRGQASARHHHSRGLQLLQDRLDTLRRAGWGHIRIEINDLATPSGKPNGTRVRVMIPTVEDVKPRPDMA